MTPMAARQQKGITAGYVGRPRELNLVAQTGESRCGSCVGKRIRRAMLFCCLAPSVPARLMLWRYASRGGSGQPVQLGTLPAA
jgi:hypothetical protein